MSIEADFRARAVAHAPLVAMVAQRVALNAAPQEAGYPLIAYEVRHAYEYNLDGTVAADIASIEAACWDESSLSAEAVADALVAAVRHLEAVSSCVVVGRETAYDTENDLHASVVTFEWMV